jgi:hypothetical protein
MYNNGNSSKNVTGASIVDGTVANADIDASAAIAQSKLATLVITDAEVADNALSGDKIDAGIISNFQSTGIDDRGSTAKRVCIDDTGFGIGTTSPTQKLHVDSGNALVKSVYDAGGSTEAFVYLATRSSGNWRNAYIGESGPDLVFGNGGTGTDHTNATEKMRLLSTGGITFNGDTAAANALDDYEEGTFSGTTLGSTYSGVYTKIGDTVSVRVECTIAGGNYGVAVLPFTPSEFIGVLPFSNSTSSNTDFVQTYLATTGMYLYSRAGAQIVSIPAGTIRFMLTYKT